MDRRSFLKVSVSTTTMGILSSQLSGCFQGMVDDLGYRGDNPFWHGVASGDPLSHQVILWTRISQGNFGAMVVPVGYVMATDIDFKNIVAKGTTQTSIHKDFTVKIDVHLPKDNTTYYYAFQALGYISPIGRTRTAPASDVDLEQARFAVCSCANFGLGYFNAYADIAKRHDLSAVLHLGDYIYEYQTSIGDPFLFHKRKVEPAHEIITLSDYRKRYASYRLDPDLQECHRQHPWITVWDDHEFANDTWKEGAQNHQKHEGDFQTRKLAAVQAYREWMPIRDHQSGQLSTDLRIFRHFDFGQLIHLAMLDTRVYGRDKPNLREKQSPHRSLLGLEQENWLYLSMLNAKAQNKRWQLIGQQVILSPIKGSIISHNSDVWNGYEHSRNRFLDFIKNNQMDNTVILTGDYHMSMAFDVCKNPFDRNQYHPKTGQGSIAVEYVCPAITSLPFAEVMGKLINPHQKFLEQIHRGYMLLDVNKTRCQCEWYFVNNMHYRDGGKSFLAKSLATFWGQNRIQETNVSSPISQMPQLAPNIQLTMPKKR